MPIKFGTLDPGLRALVGMLIGDIFFVDCTAGDVNSTGVDQDHALKSPDDAMVKVVSGHNDHVLCYGTHTQTASLAVAASHVHLIGIGGGGASNEAGRGCVWTCMATNDSIIPAATADYLEIAGFLFNSNATDAILIDDAGATDGFFHHNTVMGSTTASDAIRLDLEGARWTINDNIFSLCKLPIDVVGANCVIRRNNMDDVDTGAKGVVIGATAHRCIVTHNDFNFSGGTGDIGITITASADDCLLAYNTFEDGISDCINDSGTNTHMVHNYQASLAGTSGASLPLLVED